MDGPARSVGAYAFDRFQLDPVGRTLTCEGAPVRLAARLFDTLLYLVEHHGRLVERDELLRAVWPARTVDATSLGMAISSLRAALKPHGAAENLIVTAPGRGYRFGARVTIVPMQDRPASAADMALLPAAERPPFVGGAAEQPSFVGSAAERPPLVGGAAERPPSPPRQRWLWIGGIAACVALAAVLNGRMPRAPFGGGQVVPPPHSIAVLPFDNMSGDARETYFADGLSEELIDALGRVGALRVAARVSSFSFRGKSTTVADIGRQLHVGTLLEGSLRRDGGRVRVTVQLIDAVSGFQMWSRSYDRDQGDVLMLEGQIAGAVIASLKVVLLGDAASRLTPGGTINGRALDAYLAGLANVSEADLAADQNAIDSFTVAIRLDPNFALAFAGRARALCYLATNGTSSDPGAARRKLDAALQDAERSVALAPDLGEAHAALGFVLKSRLENLARAGAEYARAVELSPGDASISMRYALFQVALGHKQEAVDAAEHAAALDPLTPGTYRLLARVLTFAGRYEDARAALRRAQNLQPPDPAQDRQYLAFVDMWQGDTAQALHTCGGERDPRDDICLAWAYHRLGRLADAQAALRRVQAAVGDNAAFIYALLYSQWGEQDEALHWLQTAYRNADPGLVELKVVPFPEALRQTSIYQDIEHRLGFPP
jgi:serine/threonine-protein kinase